MTRLARTEGLLLQIAPVRTTALRFLLLHRARRRAVADPVV